MNNHPSASTTPIVSPLDIALATSVAAQTPHLSMNQAPFHPYSPIVAASPSVAFSNLSLRTPHRTIPASLPPTPKLTGASPQISTPLHAFATPELPSAPLPSSSSTKTFSSLRSNYKKMRRESNANNRRTEMLPPSGIPVQSPMLPHLQPVVMEDWVDFTTFMQEVGNGTPPMTDSHSPSVGTGPLPMGTTPVLGVGADETWDLLKMIVEPVNGNTTLPSPTIQQPLDATTPFSSGNNSGFHQSPAVTMPDELSAYFHNPVAGPSSGSPANYSDVLSSPTHVPSVGPSPRPQQWPEFPLFTEPSPPVNLKTFTPVSSGAPNLSQESVASSSTSGQTSHSLSVPPPRAPSMSPSIAKRPRLSFDGSGHRRNPSSSSSAAPSPYIGAGSSSTKPTGYRRHMLPNDLTPLDAPTQKRNYAVPSVTSRKDFPPSVTKSLTSPSPRGSKRSSAAAGLPTRDDAEQADRGAGSSGSDNVDTDELKQAIEEKRRANTIAARKSRLRKAEYLSGLQLQIQGLTDENEQLRQRVEAAEQRASVAEQRAEMAEQQLRQFQGLQMPF